MASRLALKVNSKRVGSPCREHRVVLLSPVGKIEIWGCDRGVHEIKLPQMSALPSRAESSSACEVCEGTEGMPEPLQQCTAWLRAYFSEPGGTGTLPVPALHHPLLQTDSFTRQVLWTLLNDVKFGEAVSYKQLAELAGNSRAARAVGGAMRSNPIPIIIPCHRVIRSSGDTGNYGGGQILKEWLLSHERMQKEKLQEKLKEKLQEEKLQEEKLQEKLQKERMQEEKMQKERMQEKLQEERMQEKLQQEKLLC
uniref:Methylated-DNA--protein-cysteine methyltransferase n=1 Tax=Malurus cyaneus samueli TaxID=2593467 RepID=A0A8C5X6L2_9PASS